MKILLVLLISSQVFAATIKSGNSTDEMTVDPASKAARTTLYDSAGHEVNSSFPLEVSLTSGIISLPAGASTSALQTTGNASLSSIDSKLTSPLSVIGTVTANAGTGNFTVVQPSGASLHVNVDSAPITAVTQSTSPWVVSGTVTANQGGTWTVQPGNTANTTAWKVDGSAVTQPVSIAGTVQSNVSQINGVTPLMGNGVTGTGSQRVTIASNNTAFTVNAAQNGTWTVQQGSTPAAIGNAWPVKITDGTNTVAPTSSGSLIVSGLSAVGSAPTLNPVSVSGVDGGGLKRALLTSADGTQIISPVDSFKETYRTSITNLVLAATPTDFITLTGSASKTIRVTNIHLSCTQTAGSYPDIVLLKRSTANSGGTSTSPTIVPLDSNNAAASAVMRAYTANPTLGTLVGNLMVERLNMNSPTVQVGGGNNPTGTNQRGQLWEFGRLGQAIVLRGTSQVLALNGNSVTITGNSCDSWLEWTEE